MGGHSDRRRKVRTRLNRSARSEEVEWAVLQLRGEGKTREAIQLLLDELESDARMRPWSAPNLRHFDLAAALTRRAGEADTLTKVAALAERILETTNEKRIREWITKRLERWRDSNSKWNDRWRTEGPPRKWHGIDI